MLDDDALDRLIAGAAPVLDLSIAPEWHDAVRLHLGLSLRHALAVAAFDLPDDAEPAPMFRA